MLTIDNLTFAYAKQPVLQGFNLRVETGLVHGIMGLNGSGKTTLYNLIYGALKPDAGQISWAGSPITTDVIGYLETHPYFYPRITGREYLNLFQLKNEQFDVERWNSIFQLPLDQLITSYSTGMKKKLSLMGILCLNRPLWILDEPFNGLDLDASQTLKMIVAEAAEMGTTILITSHVLESLTSICHSIRHLYQGEIARTFEGEEIRQVSGYLDHLQRNTREDVRSMLQDVR